MKHSEIGLVLPTPGQWKSTVSIWVSCQADFFFNEQAGYEVVLSMSSKVELISYLLWKWVASAMPLDNFHTS